MSNMIERNIFVLRDASSVAQPIEYVQGTNAVPILLHVRDYAIPANSTARVYVEWSSTKGEYDESGVAVVGNDIVIEPKDTLFSEVGKSNLQVCIVNGEKTLVTFSYPVMVKKNHVPGIATPSQNHSDFLDEYIANMTAATSSANEAAEKAKKSAEETNDALDAFKGALEGTVINDKKTSAETTYSSEKIEKFDIQTSADYTLPNSKKGGYRLNEVVGNTEQKQLSGKNLLNVDETVSFDHSYVPVKLKAGTYHVTCLEVTSDGSNGVYIVFNSTPYKLTSGCDRTVTLTEDYSTTVGLYSNGYDYVGSDGITATIKQLMISAEGGEYEPYCGGTPSPNPSFTQAIENTFDCVEMMNGYYDYTTGSYRGNNGYVCSKRSIPCKGGDIVKIIDVENSLTNGSIVWFNDNTFLRTSYIQNNGWQATAPSGATNFKFNLVNVENNLSVDKVGKITLTVNGKHVGQIVESDVENLFNYSSHVANGNVSQFEVVGGKTLYRNSQINLRDAWVVYDVYDNPLGTFKTYQGAILEDGSIEVILPTNAKYVSTTDTSGVSAKLETLYIGYDLLSKYENRTEKVTTFFLDEPLRVTDKMLKENGLAKVERFRQKIVFKGTEHFVNDGEINGFNVYGIDVKNRLEMGTISIADGVKFLCTHYPTDEKYYTSAEKICVYTGATSLSNKTAGWFEFATNFATLDEFKAYLAEQYANGTPVIIEFTRLEARYETLDTESQIAINEIVTFDGVTYIEVDSKIPPTSISGEYGTSQVGAYTLKCMNDNDTDKIERADMETQIETLRNMILSLGGNV